MSDDQLAKLFAEGTSPERDPQFASRVTAEVDRARLTLRLCKFAIRALMILTLAGAVFVTGRLIGPLLRPIAEISPQFMGVPLPLVACALTLFLGFQAWRFVRLRLY